MVLYTVASSFAAVYTVGEGSGWALGVDYSGWTSDKTFVVGDTLVFNYGSGHTVDEVSDSDYKTCTVGNSISTDSSGATKIALKTAGTHNFICAVMGHCTGGMKLAVNVAAGSTASPSGTPATTTPSDASTRNTTGTTVYTPGVTTNMPQGYSASGTLSPWMAIVTTCVALFTWVLS